MRIILFVFAAILSAQASALTLHVSPGKGSDNFSGTAAKPLRSLQGAQAYLIKHKPRESVVIKIAAGKFVQRTGVVWKYNNPPYNVIITGAGRESTVFEGAGSGIWMAVSTPRGEAANLVVSKIGVTRYGAAVSVQGSREDPSRGWISEVHLRGMDFTRIGGPTETAAVRFVNTRNSSVTSSRFVDIRNTRQGALMHAVYLAHYSSSNVVQNSGFSIVSGDPIRVRDGSNRNLISGNYLQRAGVTAHFSDWYCVGSACTKSTRECPSDGNVFRDNRLGVGFSGKRIATFKVFGASNYCGPVKRISTARNVNI